MKSRTKWVAVAGASIVFLLIFFPGFTQIFGNSGLGQASMALTIFYPNGSKQVLSPTSYLIPLTVNLNGNPISSIEVDVFLTLTTSGVASSQSCTVAVAATVDGTNVANPANAFPQCVIAQQIYTQQLTQTTLAKWIPQDGAQHKLCFIGTVSVTLTDTTVSPAKTVSDNNNSNPATACLTVTNTSGSTLQILGFSVTIQASLF